MVDGVRREQEGEACTGGPDGCDNDGRLAPRRHNKKYPTRVEGQATCLRDRLAASGSFTLCCSTWPILPALNESQHCTRTGARQLSSLHVGSKGWPILMLESTNDKVMPPLDSPRRAQFSTKVQPSTPERIPNLTIGECVPRQGFTTDNLKKSALQALQNRRSFIGSLCQHGK
ncbi:hypothetical protein RRG08_046190 [Elysia crispata]|uniref:Uncharacterized protein n=1 Tax=Elysia crispata TaxID=231223 RepID=A0AAE0XNB6_9GAST|nr:hypothetical protein RRG08_046190 [Elysia crispata]